MATFVAVAAPAAPAIPWALLTLGSALIFCVSWGLLHGWGRTFGALFQWLGKKAISASVRGVGFTVKPFGFLLTLDEQIRAHLGQAVAASENAMVTSFHRMVGIIVWTGQELAGLATDAYSAIAGAAVTVKGPLRKIVAQVVHVALLPFTAPFNVLIHHVIPSIRAAIRRLEAAVHHTAVALPRQGAKATDWFGRTARQIRRMNRRLTALEKLALGAGTAGLIIARLSKRGFGCFFGRNGQMIGKRLCRVDSDYLDALLLGGLFVSSAVSVVEFARDLEAIEDEVIGILSKLIREFPSVQEALTLEGPTFPH